MLRDWITKGRPHECGASSSAVPLEYVSDTSLARRAEAVARATLSRNPALWRVQAGVHACLRSCAHPGTSARTREESRAGWMLATLRDSSRSAAAAREADPGVSSSNARTRYRWHDFTRARLTALSPITASCPECPQGQARHLPTSSPPLRTAVIRICLRRSCAHGLRARFRRSSGRASFGAAEPRRRDAEGCWCPVTRGTGRNVEQLHRRK